MSSFIFYVTFDCAVAGSAKDRVPRGQWKGWTVMLDPEGNEFCIA